MNEWATYGVEAWWKRGWLEYDLKLSELMAPIIGAKPHEITMSSGLSENIHKLVSTFYKPQAKRNKIIVLKDEFPSDIYAISSQIQLKGLDPKECMIQAECNHHDSEIATEDLISQIEKYKEEVSIVWFSLVNYLTSNKFQLEKIVAACKKYDIKCLVELAHAAGSIPLSMHDMDVDGAVWCTYKYLNSGPGCMGGLMIHEKHSQVLPGM